MSVATTTPVRVTRHALERFAQRIGRPAPVRDVVYEVETAIAEGRVACRKPAFLNQRRIRNHAGRGKVRFAWPESRSHVYVLRFVSDAIVVLTVEVPQ